MPTRCCWLRFYSWEVRSEIVTDGGASFSSEWLCLPWHLSGAAWHRTLLNSSRLGPCKVLAARSWCPAVWRSLAHHLAKRAEAARLGRGRLSPQSRPRLVLSSAAG